MVRVRLLRRYCVSGDRAKRKRSEQNNCCSEASSEESKKEIKRHKHDRSSVKKKRKKEKKKKSSSKEFKKDKKLHKRHKPSSKASPDVEDIVGPTMTVSTPPQQPTTAQRSLGPMTKEQYEKKQSTMRRIYDEDTGRYRLIRGDGEIVEEIVSKERQQQINKIATAGDGTSFQSGLKQFCK